MWRFWRALPPKGKIGILFGAWHTQPIVDRVMGVTNDAELEQRIADVQRFERMLADEGTLILKFWFHITEKQQRARFKELASDPRTAWRVTDRERSFAKQAPSSGWRWPGSVRSRIRPRVAGSASPPPPWPWG